MEPIAKHFRWCDGSPRYDEAGYATAPPSMRGDSIPERALQRKLRQSGKYLPPDMVGELTQQEAERAAKHLPAHAGHVPPEVGYC